MNGVNKGVSFEGYELVHTIFLYFSKVNLVREQELLYKI